MTGSCMNVSAENIDWRGTIAFAPMLALFVGNGGKTIEHQTVAHKIILGTAPVNVGGVPCADGVDPVVLSGGTSHQFDASGCKVVMAYLDARFFTFEDTTKLAEKWRGVDPESVSIDCLQEDTDRVAPRFLEARMLKAMIALQQCRSIREAANSLGLSEGRFTHMISERLGAPPQQWRRWLRLRKAVDLVADGENITAAAHDAGFSDAAHFSRTCVNALGIRPSILKNGRTRFIRSVEACEVASI